MDRFRRLAVRLFRLRLCSHPIWSDALNIPNNNRHFIVAEEVRDRCVVTSAATATWRNVDAADVQLLSIGHSKRNVVVAAPDEDRLTVEERPCC